ncbi:hypothetical protein HK101_006898, partial [Irineochytrium annulatum]
PAEPEQNPFATFAEHVQPLLENLHAEFEKSNLGPILEKIAAEAETAFQPALEEILSHVHSHPFFTGPHAQGHPFAGGRGPFGPCGPGGPFGGSGGPFGGARRGGSCGRRGACGPTSSSDNVEPRWHNVRCDGCNASSFPGARHRCTTCPDFDLCSTCFTSAKDIHNSTHEFESRVHPVTARREQEKARREQEKAQREKDVEEKLEMLRGMGFWEEEKVRELLGRYDGNVERVVEILVREQQKQ